MSHRLLFFNVILLILAAPIAAQSDFSSDEMIGCDTLTVQFFDLSTGATSWLWDFGDGTTSTEETPPPHFYSSSGFYDVTLTINGSAFEKKENYIRIFSTPDPSFWYSDTLDLNALTYVFHNPVQEFESVIDYVRDWSISDGSTYSTREFVHTFADTGTYQVGLEIYVDLLPQCKSLSSKTIPVNSQIYIPNVFSPNGDEYNDLFIVEYNNTTNLNAYIYSRYGGLIYKNSAPVIVWDGISMNGQKMNEGVYYYVITSDDGEISKAGFLHLFR